MWALFVGVSGGECLCVSCVGPAALCVGRSAASCEPLSVPLSCDMHSRVTPYSFSVICLSFAASAAVLSHREASLSFPRGVSTNTQNARTHTLSDTDTHTHTQKTQVEQTRK